MTIRHLMLVSGTLGLATLVAGTIPARADDPPADQPAGVEVLARGPVHEAYAEPVDPKPQASPIITKQPPDPIDELPPDQRPEGANVQWIPGYWGWDDERSDFIWVSGFWRVPPPGRQWVPGHWQQVEGGWQWVPGYWAAASQPEVEYVPPPPASIDGGPSVPAPGDDYLYQPGSWARARPIRPQARNRLRNQAARPRGVGDMGMTLRGARSRSSDGEPRLHSARVPPVAPRQPAIIAHHPRPARRPSRPRRARRRPRR